jgi:hypothetical protein
MPGAMARLLTIGLLAIGLALPGQAVARMTLATPAGRTAPPPWQGWLDRAQRGLWTPDVTLTFTHATCPGWGREAWGCAGPSDVWVRVSLRDRMWARWTLDHELGHVVDFNMGDARRLRVARVLRWPRWRPEAFADGWAQCANPRPFRPGVMRRLRPLCDLLEVPPERVQDALQSSPPGG